MIVIVFCVCVGVDCFLGGVSMGVRGLHCGVLLEGLLQKEGH